MFKFIKKIKIFFSKPSPIRQLDAMDCGPACLAYISKVYGKKYSLQYLRELCYISKRGVTLLGILEAGKTIGFEVFSTKVDLDTIINKVKLYPCIIHWEQNHFVVLNKIVKTKKSKAAPSRTGGERRRRQRYVPAAKQNAPCPCRRKGRTLRKNALEDIRYKADKAGKTGLSRREKEAI